MLNTDYCTREFSWVITIKWSEGYTELITVWFVVISGRLKFWLCHLRRDSVIDWNRAEVLVTFALFHEIWAHSQHPSVFLWRPWARSLTRPSSDPTLIKLFSVSQRVFMPLVMITDQRISETGLRDEEYMFKFFIQVIQRAALPIAASSHMWKPYLSGFSNSPTSVNVRCVCHYSWCLCWQK